MIKVADTSEIKAKTAGTDTDTDTDKSSEKQPARFWLLIEEVQKLGSNSQTLKTENSHLISERMTKQAWFSGCREVQYSFESASWRDHERGEWKSHVLGKFVHQQESTGFFGPIVAAHQVRIAVGDCSRAEWIESFVCEAAKEGWKVDTDVDCSSFPATLVIRNQIPQESILVFDFLSHNLGFELWRWKRKHQPKIET